MSSWTRVQQRANTAIKLLQWERRPKVVVLLYREQSGCRSLWSPFFVGVVMDALVSYRDLWFQMHPSPGVCYFMQVQRQHPIHATGYRGHTNTYAYAHTPLLCLYLYSAPLAVWCETQVNFMIQICGVFTDCRLLHICSETQSPAE